MEPARLIGAALAALALSSFAAAQDRVIPFPTAIHDFDNGLRLVTVTTDFPGIVSVHCVVSVGSRQEVEEGRSGFAHFFEHMMFRGTKNLSSAEQAAIFKAAGADRNAYTTDDYTNYHTTVPTEELETVLRLEADRFQNLQYEEKAFRTEAMAVFGEYNKNSSNPINMLFERIRATAFDAHTYEHTTMGFLKDIRAMPRMYDYSLEFFDRFYRPEYTTLVVVGDVSPDESRELVERYWGGWKRGSYTAQVPAEPPQDGARQVHVKWPSPTDPWVVVAFKGPAFSVEEPDMQALDLLSQLYFGPTSAIYTRLFVREQLVDTLFPYFPDQSDPGLVYVFARVRDPKDWETVTQAIIGEYSRAREELVDEVRLEDVKRAQKYSFLGELDSSEAIADALASYVARARTPAVIDGVYANYRRCTPEVLRRVARRYFRADARTIATLSHEPLPGDGEFPTYDLPDEPVPGVFLPNGSPLVSFRLVYPTGAVDDPAGKAGLAHVTAQMLTEASTERRSYEQLLAAFYPMAAGVGATVDEEVTTIAGTVHRDNLEEFYALLTEMLLEPAFAEGDLARIKANTISAIDIGLRRSDDEELGKEVLLQQIFHDHPYHSLNMGGIESVASITVDDVRSFWKESFRGPVIGLAGGYPDGFPARMNEDLGGSDVLVFEVLEDVPPAPAIDANRLTIVEKQALATGIHIGFPIDVKRGHPDWIALWLARSYFGEHRSENSHLYQRLREIRGLNYGDYAYLEYFPNGGAQFQPPPNHPRQRPVFSIWVRPVPPESGPFALKAAYFELRKLIDAGLTQQQFESTRDFLTKYCALLVKTDDRRLGFALDQAYYAAPDWVAYARDGLAALTLDDVNRAIRTHLRADRLQMVVVTEDAGRFRDAILGDAPTGIEYQAEPPQDVLDEDAVIGGLRIPLRADQVRILPIDEVFVR